MSTLRRLPLAALACLLIALAIPALASAKTFVINTNADLADAAECAASPEEECALRGAIDAANLEPGPDLIEFDETVFDGTTGSEIEAVAGLPPITEAVTIRGGTEGFGAPAEGIFKPTVGIVGASGTTVFTIESAGVTLEDLAVGGGEVAIADKGEGLGVHGLWFGLDLDANPAPIGTGAIFIFPGGHGAAVTSGELGGEPRNVFTNSIFGVVVTGSGVKVQGNYIGVGPDGDTAAGVVFPVKVEAFASEDPVEGTEIGGELTGSQAASPACDGPCNVIVSKGGAAIGLNAESGLEAPAGPTTIRGNYVNLAADGLGPVQGEKSKYGVYAIAGNGHAGPGKLAVGGIAPTDTNYFLGGEESIRVELSEGLEIAGNRIGLNADNSESESPSNIAIRLTDTLVSRTAKVSRNQLVLEPDTFGIEVQDGNAELLANQITGGRTAIRTSEFEGPDSGSLIEGNQINEADVDGISLGGPLNQVFGNTVANSGRFGIEVDHSEHNRIGGDATGQANTLFGNGVAGEESGAIVIYGEETSRNEIAANTGSANANPFIQLVGHGSGETPNGLQPPVIAAAGLTRATGTAAPGTTVRVFTKAGPEPGELGTYLGKAVADATGAWKVTYATRAAGTLVAATQTSKAGTEEAGTSALTAPTTVAFSPEERAEEEAAEKAAREQQEREAREREGSGGGGTGGGSGSGSGGSNDSGSTKPTTKPSSPPPSQPPAKVAPKVKITAGPKKSSEATTAKFKFKAPNASGAKFECKLDGARWAKCSSPKTLKGLKPGRHTFRVRAKANGQTGAAAKFPFAVKG
jgi:hypothetical protein